MILDSGVGTWTVVTFFAYVFGVFALAAAAHRCFSGRAFLREYYLGSRGLGVWTLALTLGATACSGGSFTGFPSLIYTYGWIMAVWIAGYMVVPLVSMGLFGKRLNQVARKSDAITLPDVFRDRYACAWLGWLATVFLVFFLVVYLVAQFKAGGIMIQMLLSDLSLFERGARCVERIAGRYGGVAPGYILGLAIFGLIVVLYTAYGGFRAVVWTDVMQGIIMVVGVILLLLFTLYQAYVYLAPVETLAAGLSTPRPETERFAGFATRRQEPFRISQLTEGLEKVSQHLKRDSPEALVGPGKMRADAGGRAFLPLGLAISFFFIWPFSGAGHPGSMVRLMAFRDNATLQRAILAVAVFYGLIYLPLVLVFVAAKALPIAIEQPDQAMPIMTIFVAPPILSGILMAAPFAAIMSTVDSFLLIISSSLVRDIYQRSINPNADQATIRRLSLGTTAIAGIVVLALAVNPPRFLQDLVVFASSGQAATFLVAMALTLYWPRANAVGTACAMVSGCCSVAGMYLVGKIQTGAFEPWTPLGLHPFVWGLVTSLAGGIGGSLATRPPARSIVMKYFFKVPVGSVPPS